jgi:shikimate 5-dehydrogenase
VHLHSIPFDQWTIAGRITDCEGFRDHLRADTPEKAEEALAIVYGPGGHTSARLSSYIETLPGKDLVHE